MAERKSSAMNQQTKNNFRNTNSGPGNSVLDNRTRLKEYYDMNHKYRGMAIIFSHEKFEIDIPDRRGTTVDCENLERTLEDLGFHVDVFHNLRYTQIMDHIIATAKVDHTKHDCLLIAVLSHGKSGMLYATDTHYKSQQLWCHFTEQNCPSLAGKPKLFFLQACQGENYDDGITLTNDIETDGWFAPHKYPNHPDFLLVLSTVPGYYAWRNIERGSWFIQSLCEELSESAFDTDILTLLTKVSHKVALNFESNTPDNLENHEKKQVPSIASMLTRRLLFTRKYNQIQNNPNLMTSKISKCKIL